MKNWRMGNILGHGDGPQMPYLHVRCQNFPKAFIFNLVLDFSPDRAHQAFPMFWAILITFASVLLGTALALLPRMRDSWMGPVRTFALTAALSVVIIHLLPGALLSVGVWGLGVFFLGLIAPELLGKLGETLWRARQKATSGPNPTGGRRALALEASYFGLLLHRLGDGVGLGAFTGEMNVVAGSGGVIVSLAAHAVPVVAIMVLSFDSMHGRGSALSRALGLAVASIIGVWFSHSIPHDSVAKVSGYIAAFVAGTLLHVVTHDLSLDLPKTAVQRFVDLLAAGLGIYVSLLGIESHNHAHPESVAHGTTADLIHTLLELSIETGPFLVIGLMIGALLTAWGPAIPDRFFASRGTIRDALRGTFVGAPLPLCSCSVIPISAALVNRGAGPAMVVAFLLATPELGVETFALTVRFLGWEFAGVRLLGALALAFFAGLVVASAAGRRKTATDCGTSLQVTTTEGPFAKRALHAFDELLHHIGAWMLLGLVAAALLEVAVPADALSLVDGWFAQFSAVTLIAIPSYICAPSATPLAAVLIGKGISPGAVLVGLLLGPATNIATMVFLRRWFGGRTTAVGLLGVVLIAWMIGGVIDGLVRPEVILPKQISGHHEGGGLWNLLAIASGLVILRALYRAGARGFLSTLIGEHGHSHGEEGHNHGHAHRDEPITLEASATSASESAQGVVSGGSGCDHGQHH